MSDFSTQALNKPPRLLPDGTGYDWKEFDRWLQRVYLLLGMPSSNSSSLNLILTAQNTENQDIDAGTNFALDHQQEIKNLERRLVDLGVDIDMAPSSSQDIKSLWQSVANIEVEIMTIIDQQQQIINLLQLVQNAQTSVYMGV